MPFIASNGLTEAGTSKTSAAGGMNVTLPRFGRRLVMCPPIGRR